MTEQEEVKIYNDEYIFYQEGNIPFILTFPHSGTLKVPGVPTRKKGIIDPDHFTEDVAMDMIRCFNCVNCCCNTSEECKSTCKNNNSNNNNTKCGCHASCDGYCVTNDNLKDNKCYCYSNCDIFKMKYNKSLGRPFIVFTKIHRENVDFNRSAEHAYEDQRMKIHYDTYHNKIKEYIETIKSKFSNVMLLDIHGQSDLKEYIVRGTKDGQTVQRMVKEFGINSLIGENSIFGSLYNQSIPIFPNYLYPTAPLMSRALKQPLDPKKEHPAFTGAFTVQNYSNAPYNCDTIQVEIGYKYRSAPEHLIQFSKSFRNSIIIFYNNYYNKTNTLCK